ncbi:MAG: DUF4124 domain-containing protein [Comamonadaceae bacterium]|nr:DUF4124 domain-containing protein [Comamonadaceae bacterium]
MLKRTLWFMLVTSFCGVTVTTQAQQYIYKWTDPQGQVQYSELAPPPGVQYEMVRKPAVVGQETGPQARDLAKEQEELARQMAEQEQKEKQQADQAQKEAEDARQELRGRQEERSGIAGRQPGGADRRQG